MSKNITIAEGGQAKNFNSVAKIRTNLIGSGTQNWIPEDEAGRYANLGEVSIDENGTYRASDENLDGFSKITVNVPTEGGGGGGGGHEPRLITKNITANGTYNASGDGADGYSSVTVNVQISHGRVVLSGINNAPVSERIDTESFIMDFSERLYSTLEPHLETESTRAIIENIIRTGNWARNNRHLSWIFGCNDLVLIAWGGLVRYSTPDVAIWLFAAGIGDTSGTVSINEATYNGCKVTLNTDNKFVRERPVEWVLRGPSAGGGTITDSFLDLRYQMNASPRPVGPSSDPETITLFGDNGEEHPLDPTINTGIVTNLTGGTVV